MAQILFSLNVSVFFLHSINYGFKNMYIYTHMHMYTYTYNLVVNVYILISKTLFKATAQFDWGLNDASLLDLKAKSINKKM